MLKLLQVSVAVATPVTLVRVSAGQLSVTPAGQMMLGGLVSCTVIVWTQLARLVHASVEIQGRNVVNLPTQQERITSAEPINKLLQEGVAVATPMAVVRR